MTFESNYKIGETDPQNDADIDAIVEMTMRTVLETIPEFGNSSAKVLETFSNFTFSQMRSMIVGDFPKPDYRSFIAHDESGQVVGHLLCSVKRDENGRSYGYLFSMFVEPSRRRTGLGSAFMKRAFDWFAERNVAYALGETHAQNFALQKLAEKTGFKVAERKQRSWPVLVLIQNEIGEVCPAGETAFGPLKPM